MTKGGKFSLCHDCNHRDANHKKIKGLLNLDHAIRVIVMMGVIEIIRLHKRKKMFTLKAKLLALKYQSNMKEQI